MGVMKKGFLGVMAAFMVSAVTPLLIPLSLDGSGNMTPMGYAAGVMFWAGLIVGIAGYVLLYRVSKEKLPKEILEQGKIGALRFFSNQVSKITDALLIIGLAGTIYCVINTDANQILAMGFLFILLASVYLHFLLNGKLYKYIESNSQKIRKGECVRDEKA